MPRKPRAYLPGIPCHVIQRGNNRQATFFAPEDHQFYLECLGDACRRYGVQLHAYVLMTNHVHMLLTPADVHGISQVMQSIGRRFVQYVNRRYRRSGTMWEGRHKASLVEADDYLFACQRYIELNPVRANMVDHPAKYKWSSYRCNAFGEANPRITPHVLYEGLGPDPQARTAAYRDLFVTALDPGMAQHIGIVAECSMPLGSDRFREQIEAALGRSLGQYQRGRPRKRSGGEIVEN